MEYPGLLSWANSVRLSMASDPGRQLFKEQVQIHGFLFLDNYLESIISGQKQEYAFQCSYTDFIIYLTTYQQSSY